MDDTENVLAALALGVLATGALVVLGCHTGETMERSRLQTEAIERGYAEHDSKTGEWRWREGKQEN